MGLFEDLNSGNISLEDDVIMQESFDDVFMEYTTVDKIPYFKTLSKQVILPIGVPMGKGNICFLYSKSIKESMEIMTSKVNMLNNKKYRLYYYPLIYKERINNRRYFFHDVNSRSYNYEEIHNNTDIIPYERISVSNSESRNIFIDLSRYINLFESNTEKLAVYRTIPMYWEFFNHVLAENYLSTNSNYYNRFMVIDISNYRLGKVLKENLKNPLFMVYYSLLRFYSVIKTIDIDMYFYNGRKVLRVNPSQANEKTYALLRTEMKKLMSGTSKAMVNFDGLEEEVINNDERVDKPLNKVMSLVDDNKPEEIKDNPNDTKPEEKDTSNKEEIRAKVNKIVHKVKNDVENTPVKITGIDNRNAVSHRVTGNLNARAAVKSTEKEPSETNTVSASTSTSEENIVVDTIDKKVEDEINQDKELLNKIYNEINASKPKQTFSSARDKMLLEKQKDINVNGMTIADLKKIKANNIPIPERDISNQISTTNNSMKVTRFSNFDKAYNDNLYKKDITDAILSLNDKSIPLFILDINTKDTSDELNYKETITVHLEDAQRKRHTLKFDVPKFLEDNFMYFGGNKKLLKYQTFFYPVIKTNENTVQIVTNYSKIIIQRKDGRLSSSIDRFKKILRKSDELKSMVVFGNVSADNIDYVTTIEYDQLAKIITDFKSKSATLFFDQINAHNYAESKNISIPENKLFIGVENGKNLFIDINTQVDSTDRSIIDIIMQNSNEEIAADYLRIRPSKTGIIAEANIMKKAVPVGVMLGIWEGFSSLLKKANVEYRLENKVPKELASNENYIQFLDCVLVYKSTVPISLLLNGFGAMDTSKINLTDMDKRDSYIPYLIKKYGQANIENALMNFYEFMIDPITSEILTERNMPTDIVSLVIYAINLLGDSQFVPEINMGLSRIRKNEVIPAVIYRAIADAYLDYRNSNGRKGFSVSQNAVFKLLSEVPTLENYSTLNPMLELQMKANVSSKGYRGLNLDSSYSIAKRSFDNSMIGIVSSVSSPDANVGVMKNLTMEPNIANLRGEVNITDAKDLNKLHDNNVFTVSELTMPLSSSIDDSTRLGFRKLLTLKICNFILAKYKSL